MDSTGSMSRQQLQELKPDMARLKAASTRTQLTGVALTVWTGVQYRVLLAYRRRC